MLPIAIVFRFKVFPFLRDRILPKYNETLRKEGNSIIVLTDYEHAVLEKYASFLGCIYQKNLGELKKEIDVNEMHPFFEIMEKHVNIFLQTMQRSVLDEDEKNKIIAQFDTSVKPYVAHILS